MASPTSTWRRAPDDRFATFWTGWTVTPFWKRCQEPDTTGIPFIFMTGMGDPGGAPRDESRRR
jgi:hypothetical protein